MLSSLNPPIIVIFLYLEFSVSAFFSVSVLLLSCRDFFFFFAKTWRNFKWVGNSKEKTP